MQDRTLDPDVLLEQVRLLARELRPSHDDSVKVSLDSSLDKDLGFDSLSRVELSVRLERVLGVSLAEQQLATAETPRDLWRAVVSAAGDRAAGSGDLVSRRPDLDQLSGVPDDAQTLLQMLDWHVQRHPRRPHVYLYGEAQEPEEISYRALADGAFELAAGLQAQGLLPGQSVAIMLPTSRDYLFSFFGILMAGGVPVPIYPPLRPSQLEDHLRRHAGILANAGAVLLLTVPQAKGVARLLKSQVDGLGEVLTPAELAGHTGRFTEPAIRGQDTAFLQYTSGSTGAPKGVILSHADLLANIRAMGKAVRAYSSDVFVSWLPLYHDMGLIGAWLGSLYFGMPLVLLSPLAFLARPRRWLWTIHRHRGTLTAAPNFAYELCLSKLDDADLRGLDLSSLRLAFNGAEPVSPATVRRFVDRFSAFGMDRRALAPVYGLAEAAVGLAFPPPGRGLLIDRVQREPFIVDGQAIVADSDDAGALEFVACGQPLPGYEVRVIDAAGRELPERRVGRLQFRGPSATRGYLHNEVATRSLIDGPWRETGDRAYLAGGDLYLSGRDKDLIIRGGRNIYPYEVEAAVGGVAGVRKGCVAVFGSMDADAGTERVIVVAETREQDSAVVGELRKRVRDVATDLLGAPPDEVLLAPPHTVLKTSSGKIRRTAVRELFERGDIGQRPRAVWWQLVRLAFAAAGPRLCSAWRRGRDLLFAAYAHLVFWSLAPPAWLLIVLLPQERWRWAVMRQGARLLFRLTGVSPQLKGLEHWPQGQACVIIANHASYLDGVLLVSVLPPSFGFVAKRELSEGMIPRLFLKRIGAVFVERFDQQRSASDAQRTVAMVKAGRSLMYFPEGTFTRIPGLRRFHMGAFVAAAEAAVPLVPVTIQGTRSVLRGDSLFPHHARLGVTVGLPLHPAAADWDAALALRDAARAAILSQLDEPDLLQSGS